MTARGRFANSADFLVAVAAFAAGPFSFGLPNWIYSGGGVCFILNMIIFGIIFSIPLTSIEMSLGHISGLAPTATFASISPPLRVLGWIQAIVCAVFTVSIGQQTAKFLGLTIASFYGGDVVTGCDNDWNIEACKPVLTWYTCMKTESAPGSVSNRAENCIQRKLYWQPELEFNNINYTERSSIIYYGAGQFVEQFLPSNESSVAVAILIVVVWLLVLAGTVIGPKYIGKLLYILLFLPLLLLLLICVVISFLDEFESPFASNLYEDQSSLWLFTPNWNHFLSVDGAVQALTYLFAGMGVYHTLASFHRHSETVNQPEKRWKVALIAPWVALLSMTFTGVLISLIHFKSVFFLSHIESLPLAEHGLMVNDENFLSIPTAFALLNHGSVWSVLFYLALTLLCLGTMIPMFLSVVTSVVDDVRKFGGKKLLTAVALAIIHMILSHISFSDILKFVFNLNSKYLEVIILLFLITVGLFYGWHELQKDTMLALGIPKSISGVKQFFTPASQYHTALLLLVGPLFVGVVIYEIFRRSQLTSSNQHDWYFVLLIVLITFGILMILVALLAIVDCVFLLNRKPILFASLKRGFWNPLRYEAEELGHKPPLGNEKVCWCCCNYSAALLFVIIVEAIFLIFWLLSLALYVVRGVNDYVVPLPIIIFVPIFAFILTIWSLLGICRARAQRNADFLLPYLLCKMLAASLVPLLFFNGNEHPDPFFAVLYSLIFLFFQGFLVAIVVGAHWHYRAKSLQIYNQIPMEPVISARLTD